MMNRLAWLGSLILALLPIGLGAKPALKIALCQLDPICGDTDYNVAQILECYERGVRDQADLVLTPEMAVEGYSYGDYLERPEVWDRVEGAVESLRKATLGKTTALLLGHTTRNPQEWGKPLQNVASAFLGGKLVYRHAKVLLPDYDVFNDARWFHAGREANVWEFRGYRIGVGICEDWWFDDEFAGPQGQRHYYEIDITDVYAKKKIDLAVSLSASPYNQNKQAHRETIHSNVAKKLKVPFIWNAMSGATDGILYDGRSFILDAQGRTVDRLALFKTDYALVSFPEGLGMDTPIEVAKDSYREDTNPPEVEVVYQGLVSGIREYVRRTHSTGFVLGVSGGIDSAVVAALIVDAIGPEHLIAVSLPSDFSSQHSVTDAYALVRNLGVPEQNVRKFSISPVRLAIRSELEGSWQDGGLIDENTQARLRMLYLNGIANASPGYLVAVTGNKTELAMGYFTFGGDDKGSLSILGGLWKSEVYALARYINQRAGKELIPVHSITKPASAELKPDQLSYSPEQGLPPYDILDPLLRDFYEERIPLQELVNKYTLYLPNRPQDWVLRVVEQSERMDYKRRQSAAILRVDRRKTFDWTGRRVPIAKSNIHEPITPCVKHLLNGDNPVTLWFQGTLGITTKGEQWSQDNSLD